MKLAVTDTNVLVHFLSFYSDRVMPEGASYLNGPRRQAANRLAKRGLLEKVSGPMGAGYRITDTGKSAAKDFMGNFASMALGDSAGLITTISD